MLNTISNLSVLNNIRYADIADVTIIAIIIYTIFVLFKQTRSYLIIIGISFMGVLYAVAKIFNLYLTTIALQSVFSVLFVILVVIFQNELRRFFEYIALLGTRRVRARSAATLPEYIAQMVQASAVMAHEKIGGLIVLQGLDPLDRFTQGGELLDGVISENLLLSIFDPNSSGHDGACIVQQNRIIQFASQLPLSTNFKEIGKHGTRHSAGLGISERTDAMAIIISEEKGTISVCRDGKMKTLTSADELEKEITKFNREKHSKAPANFVQNLVQKNGKLKLISALCAILLWITVSARTEVVKKEFSLPITIKNLPENTLIEDSSPKAVVVTFEGRGDVAFNNIDASSLEINLPAESFKSGLNTVTIPPSAIKRPLSLNLVDIRPSQVYLLVKKYKLVNIPVTIKTIGESKKIKLISSTTTPSTIEFWLPEETTQPTILETRPIDISTISESEIVETEVLLPTNAKLKKETDKKVTVAITVEKK